MNSSNSYVVGDIRAATCNNSVEDVLYSQNSKFSSAFDVNGDGLGDNRDLFLLGNELVAAGAGQAVLDSYTDLLLQARRSRIRPARPTRPTSRRSTPASARRPG